MLFWFLTGLVAIYSVQVHPRIVCYYDSIANYRDGLSKFSHKHFEIPGETCTHLIYGFAEINKVTSALEPMNPEFDVEDGNYINITSLKNQYKDLSIILSVGGERDDDKPEKYLNLLSSVNDRGVFIDSAIQLLQKHNFDGLDLAWEFPLNESKKGGRYYKYTWKKIKKKKNELDVKSNANKENFASFIKDLHDRFLPLGLQLIVSVLPKVYTELYFNVRDIVRHVDFINLWAFDFFIPQRNPSEADYPAPLFKLPNRNRDDNAQQIVDDWLDNGAPPEKLTLGIATFGRSWLMTVDSGMSGIPPLSSVAGPGYPGPYTSHPGLLSHPEICEQLAVDKGGIKKVCDPTGKYGNYAFRAAVSLLEEGTWVGYENTATARYKARYVRARKLGGVAVVDITLDDFKGYCTGVRYPILRAIAKELLR